MKTNTNQPVNQTKQAPNQQHQNRPENKDNLDSRSGEEQDYKGDKQTHNAREKRSENKKQ